MTIPQLTEEQLEGMTVAEKDRWWLDNLYQGDAPQLTLRVIAAGFFFGGVLSITNLYIGAKVGATMGVGITAAILAFVSFRARGTMPFKGLHILENNMVQTMAGAAGYIVSPLTASMAAYIVVTGVVVAWWQMVIWLIGVALLGVLFGFLLKRTLINQQQMPFPEAKACAVVLDMLHREPRQSSDTSHPVSNAESRGSPARVLISSAIAAGLLRFLQSHELLARLRIGFLRVPEMLDDWYLQLTVKRDLWMPNIAGIPLRELTVRPSLELAMIAFGGIMGIRTSLSLLIGAVMNYCILAPWMVVRGDIPCFNDADGMHVGFRAITTWSLWSGVALMTSASIWSLLVQQNVLSSLVARFSVSARRRDEDPLKHIEAPLSGVFCALPIVGLGLAWISHLFFQVDLWMGLLSVAVATLTSWICAHVTGLTSITPTGAMGKIGQLVFGVIAPRNITANIACASITSEVALQTSVFLQNLKTAYLLGAKPRLLAIGHLVGALSGGLFSVAVFYLVFLRGDPNSLVSDEYPFPAATIWRAVAELLTNGVESLPASAVTAAMVAVLLGIGLQTLSTRSSGLSLSPIAMGLAFVIPFHICFAIFVGAFAFWLVERSKKPRSKWIVEQRELICAGIIAGAALVGVAVTAIEVLTK